jgi:aminoglycoside phosphotransferase (APT) family kinase protein
VAERAALQPAIADMPADHGLDAARLDAFLRARIAGLSGEMTVEQAAGGMSNPTYFISYGDRRMVLRKQPAVTLSPSAHRIDREYRILGALRGSAIPVPEPILFCDDPAIVGTPFYMMARLEGRVFADSSLPGLDRAERSAAFAAMGATMAAMHGFDWHAAGLEDFGRPANYFQRQFDGWARQWQQFGISDNPAIDRLIAWLPEHMPASDRAAICHGDFRVANIMFASQGADVVGIFDWELATIGHPLADLAFNLQAWFLEPHQNGGFKGLNLDALGIPSARDYLDHYYRCAPGSERLTRFHIAFAMFRAAVGLSGVAMRNETATPPDWPAAAQARRFAIAYAEAGLTAIDTWDDQ